MLYLITHNQYINRDRSSDLLLLSHETAVPIESSAFPVFFEHVQTNETKLAFTVWAFHMFTPLGMLYGCFTLRA